MKIFLVQRILSGILFLKTKPNYAIIDKSEYVVFISLTLGYEAISRGKRVAAITIRSNFTNLINHSFGWPYKFQKMVISGQMN